MKPLAIPTPESTEFLRRHVGSNAAETQEMLAAVQCSSMEQLLQETIPGEIRLRSPLQLPPAMPEAQFLKHLREIGRRNKVFKSYIGLGYYGCLVPAVIERNVFESPGWYTAYTPYQAEISQGRLEALLNFQTMICDFTGMEIANASLLDEGTAAGEAMAMLYRQRSADQVKRGANTFLVSDACFPQTIDVLRSRAYPLGIELQVANIAEVDFSEKMFGAIVQYPDVDGKVVDYSGFISRAHEAGLLVTVAADLLSLALLRSPGEMGADVVIGSAQRFGVPKGFGGPHAAYLATREAFKRNLPGRIIGVSLDRLGKKAYRMALQTREQHIRREKATSNICTAQILLANMASMYAVYHGPEGIKSIAMRIHRLTCTLDKALNAMGYRQTNPYYFDTLRIELPSPEGENVRHLRRYAEANAINFRYIDDQAIGISLDETTCEADVEEIVAVFAHAFNKKGSIDLSAVTAEDGVDDLPADLRRTTPYLTHPVFNRYHTETKMMRYIKKLENKDLALDTSMIPLGSCTMKLNAASELIPVSWPEFSHLHPFAPAAQTEGYRLLIEELGRALCQIAGLPHISFQPNSGAQGEFTGMSVIRAYHEDRGEAHRNVVLIPSSAHGTNPASATMAGLKVVIVKCDAHGNIDLEDLKSKAAAHAETLAALMVTYPSTHGVFEEGIEAVCRVIHDMGGQVYMDGANMNAQVGLTSPGAIGADVCHLNLHKTFSIPHGGGGPGMGPICVAEHLAPFLPGHVFRPSESSKALNAVASAPFGSASILLISYAYIRMLGLAGLRKATEYAILNANYVKARLEKFYPVLYTGKHGRVAHELIFDCRPFKQSAGIEVEDIAKRLMDYGFHAPTVSFPVAGTLMVEPTESESKEELDRFCDALISIYQEIEEIAEGRADRQDNVLKNAPHTAQEAMSDQWTHPYSREKAVYPLPYVRENKFWPSVARIDGAYGDRNLFCTCPPVEE